MKANPGAELIKGDREIVILHLSGERLAQRRAGTLWAVDVPFGAARKQRIEERDALDVIPVRMADQQAPAHAVSPARHQPPPERISSGSAVQDKQCAV